MLVATELAVAEVTAPYRRKHMDRVYRLWIRFNQPPSGQSMAEYALVITLVAAAGLAVWSTLGGNIKNVISSIANCI
jgi:Flp pilus assembly pilin Flp